MSAPINLTALAAQISERGYTDVFDLPAEIAPLLDEFSLSYTRKKTREWSAPVDEADPSYSQVNFSRYWEMAGCPYSPRNPAKYSRDPAMFSVLLNPIFRALSSAYFGTDAIWASHAQNFRPKSSSTGHIRLPWHADRHAWKENVHVDGSHRFDFLIFWISTDSRLRELGGGVDMLSTHYANGLSVISAEMNQATYPAGFDPEAEHPYVTVSPNRNQCFAFNSYTYHRSANLVGSKDTIWTFDLRYESGSHVSQSTKDLGFSLSSPPTFAEWAAKYTE